MLERSALGRHHNRFGFLFGANILNAGDAFDVLAVGGIAFFLAYVNLHILAGIESPRAAGVSVIGGLVLDIVLSVPLTYWFGIRGTAIAGVCGYGLVLGLSYVAMRDALRIAFPVRAALGSLGVGVLVGLAAFYCRGEGWISVQEPVMAAVCGSAIGAIALVVMETTGLSDFRALLSNFVGPAKK